MRRTAVLCRNHKGFSWFGHYEKHGQDGFRKYQPPTPFDWTAEHGNSIGPKHRSRAVFTIKKDREILGDLTFELANDIVPKLVENFCRLVRGQGEVYKGYLGTPVHIIRKGEMIMGGDIVQKEGAIGKGSHSSYKDQFIPDENFIIPHSARGTLR